MKFFFTQQVSSSPTESGRRKERSSDPEAALFCLKFYIYRTHPSLATRDSIRRPTDVRLQQKQDGEIRDGACADCIGASTCSTDDPGPLALSGHVTCYRRMMNAEKTHYVHEDLIAGDQRTTSRRDCNAAFGDAASALQFPHLISTA